MNSNSDPLLTCFRTDRVSPPQGVLLSAAQERSATSLALRASVQSWVGGGCRESKKGRLFLVANLVTTSKALVTRSDALVPSSFLQGSKIANKCASHEPF